MITGYDACFRVLRATMPLGIAAGMLIGLGGCHLVTYGNRQTITLETTPPGAVAAFKGQKVTTPAQVTVNRRDNVAVFSASMEGYGPRCEIVKAETNKVLTVLDSVPVPIFLAIDAMAGALEGAFPKVLHLTLEPLPPGSSVPSLPSDYEVLRIWDDQQVNLCRSQPEVGVPAASAGGDGAPAQGVPEGSVEQRLERLNFLLEQGLITRDEYKRRREEILQSL